MMWLPDGEKKLADILTGSDTVHERDRQTDRRTNGQTPHEGIGRSYV